jgi:hypothetical protein
MTLQCDDADESCGLPGDEGIIGKKCGESAEVVAGNSTLSEGCLRAKVKWSFPLWDHVVKMISTRRAHRDEDVGVGFT